MPLASYVTEVSEIDKRNRLGCLERVPSRRAGRWLRSLAALAGFLRRVAMAETPAAGSSAGPHFRRPSSPSRNFVTRPMAGRLGGAQ